ncbi:MAG: phenylalanine--tRNA ligase subunit alpha [Egibacteraceae bacterium]
MNAPLDIDHLLAEALPAIVRASSLGDLAEAESELVGRRGTLTLAQRSLGSLPLEQRREVGQRLNAVRTEVSEALARRRAELEVERDHVVLAREAMDVTLPPRTPRRGSLHPLRETMDALIDVFVGLGYRLVNGPEVESDWYNFDALNTPMDHPARQLRDTIYVRPLSADTPVRQDGTTGILLRTETSPVQIRTMLAQPPPLYIVSAGRVYRQDTPDATHLPAFHQIEGLAIDEGLSMADLRGTLAEFAKAMLGERTKLRFRPHHFPFTEPSAEMDAFYNGRWMELLGAGMVHPEVLRNSGYDPEKVQGFAFGMGLDRVAMLRHGVTDIRLFVEGDLRFLSAF